MRDISYKEEIGSKAYSILESFQQNNVKEKYNNFEKFPKNLD